MKFFGSLPWLLPPWEFLHLSFSSGGLSLLWVLLKHLIDILLIIHDGNFYSHRHFICIQFYKCPSKQCFHWIPQILMSWIYFQLDWHIFKFLLRCPPWPMFSLEVCCLISIFHVIFQLSFYYWFLLQIHCGLRIFFLCHCFQFVKCLMAPNYGPSECSVWVWEECVFYCHWLKSSVDVIWPSWLIMLFSSSVFLLNFYNLDSSMTDKMFWFLTIIMSSSIYPRNSVNFWHCC